MNHLKHWPWDTSCDATRVGLERMMRALIVVDGYFTSSITLGAVDKPSRTYVHLRVWIPHGCEVRFTELSGEDLVKPPRVQVGMDLTPDPHEGKPLQ